MQKFTIIKSVAAPMPGVDIDTDQIYPKQFLRTIQRRGLSDYAFYDLRFENDGTPKSGFILDHPPYDKAEILITGKNFGGGSSREHAVWSLMDLGIKAIISPSFGDIFYNNSFKNGLLPIKLPENRVKTLMEDAKSHPNKQIEINLEQKTVKNADNNVISFEIDEFRRHCLLNGLDDIALTLEKEAAIDTFEDKMKQEKPWIRNDHRHAS